VPPLSTQTITVGNVLPHAARKPEPPQTEEMDAAEVLCWIAFRRALHLGAWGKELYTLSQDWPVSVQTFYDSTILEPNLSRTVHGPLVIRSLLEDLESGVAGKDDKRFMVFYEGRFKHIRSIENGSRVSEFLADLKSDMVRAEAINRKINVAAGELRRALAAGQLQSAGKPEERGPGGVKILRRLAIEPSTWIIGMNVYPDGTAREQGLHETLSSLLFLTQEVLAKWPTEQSVDGGDSQRKLPDAGPAEFPAVLPMNAAKEKGGRPVQHDWDSFWIEVAIWVEKNSFDENYKKDLVKYMADWSARTATDPDKALHPQTIRKKVADLYARAHARNRVSLG
jgi:hypothetical protein